MDHDGARHLSATPVVRRPGRAGGRTTLACMSNEQPGRPTSPWARFARPAPTDPERGEFPFGPPRPLHPEAPADRPWPLDVPLAPSTTAPHQGAAPSAGRDDARHVWAPPPHDTRAPEGEPAADAAWAPDPATATEAPHRAENGGLGSYFFPTDDDWTSPPPRDGDPGRGLAIASVVFGVFFAPLGLVFGVVAARRARREGRPATLAVVGTVVASVTIVLGLVLAVTTLDYYSQLATACAQLGPGDYVNGDGQTVTCD